ncbi:MAG: type II toxin-antitoxin system VapC family toxin [Gemmatimonadales bacterium]
MHLLDTSICVAILRGTSDRIRPRFRAAMSSGVAISSISAGELYYGLARSARPERNRVDLDNLLGSVSVLPFEARAAEAFGLVRNYLETRRKTIGPFDLLIAAHAIAENAVLVTNNTREFSRVPMLEIDDWL